MFATLATVAPSIYSGLKHEYSEMSKDHTKFGLKKVGHGFRAFTEGVLLGDEAPNRFDRTPNNNTSNGGSQLNPGQTTTHLG